MFGQNKIGGAMKILVSIFFLITYPFLASGKEIVFYDSSGVKYSLANFKEKIQLHDKANFNDPVFILIETPSTGDKKYIDQHKALSQMGDFIENETVFIIASCSSTDLSDGYYIPKKNSKEIKKFKILILDQSGKIFYSSNKPLNKKQLKKTIRKISLIIKKKQNKALPK